MIGGVRKVYLEEELAGSETEYWERSWEEVRLDVVPQVTDPVLRLLANRTPRDGFVLEAGCGAGRVVAHLRSLGCPVVGIDLATRALVAARRQRPDLPLVAGDVSRFPFRDGAFRCVISLGVVEHFEQGPLDVLREHRRILSDAGVLLISVPRLSPLKRGNDVRRLAAGRCSSYRARGRIVTRVAMPAATPSPWRFHQYEFPRRVFRSFLEQTGFEVDWVRPCLVGAGVGESLLVQRVSRCARRRDGRAHAGPPPQARGRPPSWAGGLVGFLREAALHEAGTGPVGRAITRVSQEVLGHMDLVCARASVP